MAHDVVIIGSGPSGLSSAVYAGSEGLSTLLLEHGKLGGQAGMSSLIENYLGFPTGISGLSLTNKSIRQAKKFGVTCRCGNVAKVEPGLVTLDCGSTIECRAIVLALGVQYRTLNIERSNDLINHGIYYGASIHEMPRYKGQHVVVYGGANSAGQAACYFAQYACKVTILSRSPLSKSMSAYLIEKINRYDNITVQSGEITNVYGADKLTGICCQHDGQVSTVDCNALFVFIGATPNTEWCNLSRDSHGFILTGNCVGNDYSLGTSQPGIFAIGDVRSGSVKRVASAVGDGALAISQIHQYLGTEE